MKKLFFIAVLIIATQTFAQTYHTSNIANLTSNTNADNVTGYGTYDLSTGNGTNNTNYPAGYYPYGNIINFNSQFFLTQFLVANTQSGFYFRTKYVANPFTPWVRVYTTGDFNIANYLPLSGGLMTGNLSVNGNVNAKKLTVTQTVTWPDYVFDPSYKLKSLASVSEYIRQYKHLPGIASASEIAKNGVDVSQTQADLLKKIEELTLYAIAQEKLIKQQEDKDTEQDQIIKQQATEIKDLRTALNTLLAKISRQ